MTLNASSPTVVVGGGVIGLACAYYLARDGRRVTLIDRSAVGSGCSHGNCGFVCPSHCLPLAEPGAIRHALWSLFQPDAAFRIKPRWDLKLWKWLFQFARRCNQQDMLQSGQAIHSLLQSSMQHYRELMAQEAMDCEWETRGLLYAYQSEDEWRKYERVNQLIGQSFGLSAACMNKGEVLTFEPSLRPENVSGGWYFQSDSHLRPNKLVLAWHKLILQLGVEVRENCEFRQVLERDGAAYAISTSQGETAAEQVVLATGSLTPQLESSLGISIPIQPGKGYSMTMPRPKLCPRTPLIFPEYHVAVTPMQSGYRLGSIIEFAGYDRSIPKRRLKLLTDAAKIFLRDPVAEPIEEEWCGWRPMTWDSVPIIDRVPRFRNVWVAAGHNMLGVSMATGTGKLVSELIGGRTPHLDVNPYSISRFTKTVSAPL